MEQIRVYVHGAGRELGQGVDSLDVVKVLAVCVGRLAVCVGVFDCRSPGALPCASGGSLCASWWFAVAAERMVVCVEVLAVGFVMVGCTASVVSCGAGVVRCMAWGGDLWAPGWFADGLWWLAA